MLVRVTVVPTAGVAGVPVTVNDDVAGASPRMTGVLVSEALPPEPPHPARSITAHAMTAVALPEPDARLVNSLLCAPIANTSPLGDVVLSTREGDEGYCRSVGSATVQAQCLRRVFLHRSTNAVHPPCFTPSGDDIRVGPLGITLTIDSHVAPVMHDDATELVAALVRESGGLAPVAGKAVDER